MEKKHTPGPWIVNENKEGSYDIDNNVGCDYVGIAYGKEDAALISAAPDLLEACRDMLAAFDSAPQCWLPTVEQQVVEEQMKNAIAKALNIQQ